MKKSRLIGLIFRPLPCRIKCGLKLDRMHLTCFTHCRIRKCYLGSSKYRHNKLTGLYYPKNYRLSDPITLNEATGLWCVMVIDEGRRFSKIKDAPLNRILKVVEQLSEPNVNSSPRRTLYEKLLLRQRLMTIAEILAD